MGYRQSPWLVPLSAVYGRAAQLRRSWYAKHPEARRRLEQPVISVGNLVVGGSGKTPVVAAIARLLLSRGQRPGILSRGYGRRHASDGVVVVSDRQRVLATVDDSGDEPHMLARALPGVPVLVADDRYLAGRLAETQLECTVHLLDDGFQHLQLARDTDLLIVAPADLDQRVLPAGPLREPADTGHLADAVLVPGSSEDAARVGAALGVDTLFTLSRRYGAVRPLHNGEAANVEAAFRPPTATRIVAVAGIARPERFFAALRDQGWNVVQEMTFPDHHWYTQRDLDGIDTARARAGADLVITTEKDGVRVGPRAGWGALPVDVDIEPADAFAEWITGRL
jgi:tetraacyldisaccharide 4'-kinase